MDTGYHLQGDTGMYSVHRECDEKYGEPSVVFDGYGESSTKDMVHQRWAKGQAGVIVTFNKDMKVFNMKKVNFLANRANKQQFIKMLTHH